MIAQALAQLQALADPDRSTAMAAYHKTPRVYLGIAVPQIATLTDQWRADLTLDDRLTLAAELWRSNIHEARLAATRLLTQARIRPDAAAWALIQSWVPDFDGWALADHACIAGQKRIVADPSRLDAVEAWTTDAAMWTRRAALVITLPYAKMPNPKAADLAIRDRVLGWAAGYVDDRDWFIQKSVAWWLRDLSRHDADRVRGFLDQYGARLKPFAAREAAKHL